MPAPLLLQVEGSQHVAQRAVGIVAEEHESTDHCLEEIGRQVRRMLRADAVAGPDRLKRADPGDGIEVPNELGIGRPRRSLLARREVAVEVGGEHQPRVVQVEPVSWMKARLSSVDHRQAGEMRAGYTGEWA